MKPEDMGSEIDRLRKQLGEILILTNSVVQQIYQLLGELSSASIGASSALLSRPIEPIEPRPYPQPTNAAPRAQRGSRKGKPAPTTTSLLTNSPDDALLDSKQAAAILGKTPNTLSIWRKRNDGPPYILDDSDKRSPYRYRKADLLAWQEKRFRKGNKKG